MINLLPPQIKQNYSFARQNRVLTRWILAVLVAILGLVIISGSELLSMSHKIDSYNTKVSSTQLQLENENSSKVVSQVTSIDDNLNLMVHVLSKEILFSKLLDRLGNITPPNVILTNLSIAQDQSAIDITAQSTNYDAATQLQVNLADPDNQIFSKADIISITCATGNQVANPSYPCTDTIRAMFLSNNPFLFINSNGDGGNS
jgi:Tfp pilus assembly protein PilN